jgi:hypothetical protein
MGHGYGRNLFCMANLTRQFSGRTLCSNLANLSRAFHCPTPPGELVLRVKVYEAITREERAAGEHKE